MRRALFLLLFLAIGVTSHSLYKKWARDPKNRYIVIENPRENPGLFSVLNTVVGFLDLYEKDPNPGLTIDFGEKGLYYDPKMGLNWWSYYLEPVHLGKPIQKNRLLRYSNAQYQEAAMHVEIDLSREEVHRLIQKYFKIKQPILDEVDRFVAAHFQGHRIIGVHYRGTDKISEALTVPYEVMKNRIAAQVAAEKDENYRIFVATDEQGFLDLLHTAFPGKILSTESERSTDGTALHLSAKHPYRQGKETLIDALLLSKTDLLIRTQSNLSLWATYFNPTLSVIVMNQRHAPK